MIFLRLIFSLSRFVNEINFLKFNWKNHAKRVSNRSVARVFSFEGSDDFAIYVLNRQIAEEELLASNLLLLFCIAATLLSSALNFNMRRCAESLLLILSFMVIVGR